MTVPNGEPVPVTQRDLPSCCVDYQCARCGSSLGWDDCQMCPATGWYDDPDPRCPHCLGSGIVNFCLSSVEFCEANPLPGREDVRRSTIEPFRVPCEVHS